MSESETAFQEAVKLDPLFADPHAGLGFLYVARGQLEEAARELRAAKELDFRLVRRGKSSASFCFFSARTKRRCGSSGKCCEWIRASSVPRAASA
jgi:hypothetical protein